MSLFICLFLASGSQVLDPCKVLTLSISPHASTGDSYKIIVQPSEIRTIVGIRADFDSNSPISLPDEDKKASITKQQYADMKEILSILRETGDRYAENESVDDGWCISLCDGQTNYYISLGFGDCSPELKEALRRFFRASPIEIGMFRWS